MKGAMNDRNESQRGDRQYLTFCLGQEYYGIDILRVQEIRGLEAFTRIPNTPEYMKGVLNLRGTIVPIVDLRAKFGMTSGEYGKMTVIIVVEVLEKVLGIVVDSVSDVLNVESEQIQSAPEFGSHIDVGFISGIARVDGRLIALLDIAEALSDEEVENPKEAEMILASEG